MDITTEQRKAALDTATETQMFLYGDPESGAKLQKIADQHTRAITDYAAFAIAVGDAILGLAPQEKLPDLFIERMQITRPEAMKVTADVLDFLAPLGQTAKAPAPAALAPQPAATPIVTDEALAAEIAATEAALETVVQPMRTMAHDMETARQPDGGTHQASSQADLLKK